MVVGEVCPAGKGIDADACEHRRITAHAAFLRVYEPLAAFEGEQRRRWDGCRARDALTPAAAVGLEREAAVRAMVGRLPPTLPVVEEHAHVLEVDGVTLVCPWQTRLRALEALEAFVTDLPDQAVRSFLPLPVVEAASVELSRRRSERPGERSHQLSSTWQVPLRWFVLVDAEEREVDPGAAAAAGTAAWARLAGPAAGRRVGRTLVYRTPMSRARRRVARALAVLRRTVDDGVVTEGVEDLGRWLEEFHPRSLVELDYGGLVHLLDDAELVQDESARDIAGALVALGHGEPVKAAAAYGRVTARMKALQAVESAN